MRGRVHGSALLDATLARSCVLVHTVWLDARNDRAAPPTRFAAHIASWKRHHAHTDIAHVVWSGADVARLLSERHPARHAFFLTLDTEVQRCDYIRLLILHEFGGLYADADAECIAPFVHALLAPNTTMVLLLQSPLFTEAYTNCLMGARGRRHGFFLAVAAVVERNVRRAHRADGLSRSVRVAWNVPLLGTFVRALLTHRLTGPSCVDQALARGAKRFGEDIEDMDADTYYDGVLARHHEAGEWIPARWWRRPIVIASAVATVAMLAL